MKKLMLGFVVLLSLMFTGCSFFYESAKVTVINNTTTDYRYVVDYNGSLNKNKSIRSGDAGERETYSYDCEYFKGEIEDRGGDKITFYYCDDDTYWDVKNENSGWLFSITDLGVLQSSDKTGYDPVVYHNGSVSNHYTITINPGKNIEITYE